MTADQYRAALAKLGLSQGKAAAPLGISKRTSQGYALGEYPVSHGVSVILRLLLAGRITIEEASRWHVEAPRKGRK